MAEAFKETLSLDNVERLANAIHKQDADFHNKVFIEAVQQQDWAELSLMERLRAAAGAMVETLPAESGPDSLIAVLQGNDELSSWLSLICCEYVVRLESLSTEQALNYLAQMTEYFSAEFAIRTLIRKDLETCLKALRSWLKHENHHVRRLVSEGSRPRLPWGIRLHEFIEQPELVLPLLEALRDDEEEYVRRSVANHLNDIAKDHFELVVDISHQWLKNVPAELQKNRLKLIRHACRTLFKQGHPGALELFGYGDVTDVDCELNISNSSVAWEDELEFELQLNKKKNTVNKLMIDYRVYFQKANGKLAPKVFKWLDREANETGVQTFNKKHSFKTVTTRKHYPGKHRLEVYVNGIKKAQTEFELLAE